MRHGEMTEAEAEVHPHRHILTRALGVGPSVDVDLWELHVKSGDRLLLCSDGLTNEVSVEQISQVLHSVKDPRKAARALVDRANAHGGNDNVTVVVVDVLVGEEGNAEPSVFSRVSAPEPDPASFAPSPPRPEASTSSTPNPPMSAVLTELPTAAVPMTTPPEQPTNGQPTNGQPPPARNGAPATEVTESPSLVSTNGTPGDVFVASPIPDGATTLPPPQYLPTPEKKVTPLVRESRRERRRRLGVPRRITARVILFFLLLLAVPAGGFAVVRWYSMDNWYVAIDHGNLAVYRGRQGGFLGFKPRLLDLTGITTSEVPAYRLADLRGTVNEPSLKAGEQYIANLHQDFVAQQNASPLGTG